LYNNNLVRFKFKLSTKPTGLKKTTKIVLVFGIIFPFIWSCSTKKNAFLNRTLHTTATKYNVLYNGNLAYEAEKKRIDDTYEDDFTEILPIEPLKIKDELALPPKPNSQKTANEKISNAKGFARAEEKAVKAIQKHSMNFTGSEKNKQIDDAYFLLGRARYYDQRFVPALETFKYMIKKYPKSKLFNTVRIWEAKTLIRLGNEDDAIYKLEKLLKVKDISDAIKDDAHTSLAQAFLRQDSIQQVVNHLNEAVQFTRKNYNQEARNLFVLGQLYRQQAKIDSSNMTFEKLAAFKKSPYRFKIYAHLERSKNYNKDTDDTEALVAILEKMTKNRDNRPYLDGIFYQLGNIKLANNDIDVAADFYEKSLRTKQAKETQKSLSYEALGNISFDKAAFVDAGKYYDSVLNLAKIKNTKRIRRLTRKRKSLDEVIRLEGISVRNDSILNLVAMSDIDRKGFFNNYIKDLKKKDEELKIIEENKNSTGFGNLFDSNSLQSNNGGKFYFYNTQTAGFGQQEFQKIWGKRALVDNWRISNKKAFSDNENEDNEVVVEEEIDASKKYDLDYYLSKIPSEQSVIDSISKKRNSAYYNLGVIYKEQFKKYKLSTERLEKLLTFTPSKNMVLPIYYHLYKSYANFDMVKSDFYKNKITSEFSESRYAKIISNPEDISTINNDENSPENVYKVTYKLYGEEKYQDVFNDCEKSITRFSDTPIIPKFELLKAYVIAKLKGKDEFLKALDFVAITYPNTEEGKHAIRVKLELTGEKPSTKKRQLIPNKKVLEKKKKSSELLPSNEEMLKKIKKNKGKRNDPPGMGG
jgi:hypothetical protein